MQLKIIMEKEIKSVQLTQSLIINKVFGIKEHAIKSFKNIFSIAFCKRKFAFIDESSDLNLSSKGLNMRKNHQEKKIRNKHNLGHEVKSKNLITNQLKSSERTKRSIQNLQTFVEEKPEPPPLPEESYKTRRDFYQRRDDSANTSMSCNKTQEFVTKDKEEAINSYEFLNLPSEKEIEFSKFLNSLSSKIRQYKIKGSKSLNLNPSIMF